jgi:hypothetical protein
VFAAPTPESYTPAIARTGAMGKGAAMLLILAIILLIIAIAGGVIIHPILFALAIVALVLFFSGR